MVGGRDYYQVLGIHNSASPEEIKHAYRKLAKEWHPDRCVDCPEEKKKQYEEKFKEIQEAYDALINCYRNNIINQPPIINSMKADPPNHQFFNLSIIWTVQAYDPDGDQIFYKFWLKGPSTGDNWKETTTWTKSNHWIWKPQRSDLGRYQIKVEIRDERHAGEDGFDAQFTADYLVTSPPQPPKIIRFGPQQKSPQGSGSIVTWITDVSEQYTGKIYYRFWLKGPSTGYQWKLVRDWLNDKTWIWKTTFEGVHKDNGIFQVKAEIKGEFHIGPSEFDDQSVIDYILLTPIEKTFYNSALYIGLELIPQYKVVASANKIYILDFAKIIKIGETGHELKIAIELDGYDFHKEREQLTNDAERENNLKLDGWKIIRFTGSQVHNNVNDCINKTIRIINTWCNELTPHKVNQPPVIANIRSNLKSPQIPGSEILWVVDAHDPDGDQILYKFWIKSPSVSGTWRPMTNWIKENKWAWKATESDIGYCRVKVEIRDGHHADEYRFDDYKVAEYKIIRPNRPPVIHSLTSDLESPQPLRSTIIWTVNASDADGDQIFYKFWLKGPSTNYFYQAMTDWIKDNKWTWVPTQLDVGSNTIKVEVRDDYHSGSNGYDDYKTAGFGIYKLSEFYRDAIIKHLSNAKQYSRVLVAIAMIFLVIWLSSGFLWANKPPEIKSFSSDLPGLQVAGSTIKWTTMTYDSDNDILFYKFVLRGPATNGLWRDMTGWGSNNSWTWRTSPKDIGENQIKVQIRDGKHSDLNGFDAEKTASLTVTKLLPVIRNLRSSPISPQAAGSKITWVADAYNPSGDRLYYRFSIIGPSTNDQQTLMTDWITNGEWIWDTRPSDVGNYRVYVEIKGENSIEQEAYKVANFVLTTNMPPEQPSLRPDKAGPQIYGTTITWKAASSDPNGDIIYYRFLLSGPSTSYSWKIIQDWSTSNTWTWRTSSLDMGDNTVRVQVRDIYLEDSEEFNAEETISYAIVGPQPIENSSKSVSIFSSSQATSHQIAEESGSSLVSIQPPERSNIKTKEDTPIASDKTSVATSENEQPRKVAQIGEGIEQPSKAIKLGDKQPKKMVYIGKVYRS